MPPPPCIPPRLTVGTSDPMNLRLVIGIGLAFKLFVTAFILFCFYQLSDFADVPNPWSRHFTGVDNLTEWYTPFVNWDGQHYLHLAKWQWAQTPNSWAFFPLYPFLMFILAHAMPAYLAGLLLNIAFTCGFCVYLCKLAQHFGAKPLPTLFILLCFPAAFFTDVVYSEAAFLFLMLGFIYHAVIAAAEGKTVIVGMAVFIPVAVDARHFGVCIRRLFVVLHPTIPRRPTLAADGRRKTDIQTVAKAVVKTHATQTTSTSTTIHCAGG